MWPGIVAGLLFGLEFILIYRGLLYTTASRAVLFIYTAPFFVVLGARWFLPSRPLQPRAMDRARAVVRRHGASPSACRRRPRIRDELLGDVMMVVAAAAWAGTTLIIKASALNRVSAEKTMLYQLVVSAPLLALAAALCSANA